jgi:large subunit ribosomal protein L7/L12
VRVKRDAPAARAAFDEPRLAHVARCRQNLNLEEHIFSPGEFNMSEASVAELEPELQAIVAKLDGLTLLQASKVVKALEAHWGVSAAAPVAVAAAAGAAAPAAAVEEKTAFTVVLEGVTPEKKIAVIKEIRAITGLGLKEAKDLVDGAPKTVKEGATKEEAEKMKTQLETAGGKVKLT